MVVEGRVTTDVAIVGGGVAGSSLGAALAQAGLGVTIIEREAHFRDRVRGEGIHAYGVAEAERLGLLPTILAAGGTPLRYWQIYGGREPAGPPTEMPAESATGHGELSIYHPALQDALIAHAAKSGATVLRPAKAVDFRTGSAPELTVQQADGERTVRARLIIAADGRNSGARRWAGATVHSDPSDHHLIGGCLLEGGVLEEDQVYLGMGYGQFTFTIPRQDGRVRTYLIVRPELAGDTRNPRDVSAFADAIDQLLPEGHSVGRQQAGPLAFFPGTNTWADRIAGDGVVLIGDAAMATDPSVGHGLALVFRDVRELRDLLLDGDDWQAAIAEFADRKRRYQKPVRCFALWLTEALLTTGPDTPRRMEHFRKARELDPEMCGYNAISFDGPKDGMPTDETMRRHFFGDDLGD
jgi:2-polyprenyl-6-methoxyphenol hydroxylase-like FAD-dependent oxidoreductase